MIQQLFEQPSFIIGAVSLLAFIFLWFGIRKPLIQQLTPPLTKQQRQAQKSGSIITENNQIILPEQQLNKNESTIKELINKDQIEIVEGKIKAFGTTLTIKTKKTEPIVPFASEVSEAEIKTMEEDHKKTMKNYIDKVKAPHKKPEEKILDDDTPEEPEGGWPKELEENGVPHIGNAKK